MSINTYSHNSDNDHTDHHPDRLDEINDYPLEYKKTYDLLSEDEKQKQWSLLFNSEAYHIAH